MKLAPVVAAVVLAISLSACASAPETKQLSSEELAGITLDEAKNKLTESKVTYEVKVIGHPEMTVPVDAGSWESVGLFEAKERTLRSGESVTLYVKPKVWPGRTTPAPTPTPTPKKSVVTFIVSADGPIESATYALKVGTRNTEEEVQSPGTPFTKEFSLTKDELDNTTSLSLHAWSGAGTTTISCRILIDGAEQDSSTVTGTGSLASCLKLRF